MMTSVVQKDEYLPHSKKETNNTKRANDRVHAALYYPGKSVEALGKRFICMIGESYRIKPHYHTEGGDEIEIVNIAIV